MGKRKMDIMMRFITHILLISLLSFSLNYSKDKAEPLAWLMDSTVIRPIPWLTDRAVDFLVDYMEKNLHPKILEVGSGASTVWFAKRTKNLISIEHNSEWYHSILKHLAQSEGSYKVEYILHKLPYYSLIEDFEDESFDLILIDGKDRRECMLRAMSKVKPGGVLMVDNTDFPVFRNDFSMLNGWKENIGKQRGKDYCGFCYKKWETRWWIKPKS